MKKYSVLILLMLIAGPSASETPKPSILQLHWLAGCWAPNDAENGTVEQWMAPAGDAMLGMSRAIRGGRMVGFEYLRIVTRDETLVLIASPSGQETAEFALKYLGKSEVVFENPEHDFPQRINYRLLDDEHLLGRIEGATPDGESHMDFPMTKTTCAGN